MNKPLLLLSTCGTSILTNGADPDTRGWLTRIANLRELSPADSTRLEVHAAACRQRLLSADGAGRRKLSAELNGIAAVLQRWTAPRVQHLLLHTDTVLGERSAQAVAEVLEREGQHSQLLGAGGLRTDDFMNFHAALADVTRDLERWIVPWKARGDFVVFNLTGGFKSVNAYLQALGMLHADRCVFLFEGADSLMEIPRLPVRLAEDQVVRSHHKVFRRLAAGYKVSEAEVADVPDSLLLVMDNTVLLSVWGDEVWARLRKTVLADVPLKEPLSEKLQVKDAVKKAFADLSADQRVEVNEALDVLSAYLDLGERLLKSNNFKALQGDPCPPSTHQIYVSSHGKPLRVFGHFVEGGHFVADRIGPSLSA